MGAMTYTEKNIVEAYSVLFNNLSDVCKTALLKHLSSDVIGKTQKVLTKNSKVENGFALSFGRWEGSEQSTEEIKAEIKRNRKFKERDSIFA